MAKGSSGSGGIMGFVISTIIILVVVLFFIAKYIWIACIPALLFFYLKKDMPYRIIALVITCILLAMSLIFFLNENQIIGLKPVDMELNCGETVELRDMNITMGEPVGEMASVRIPIQITAKKKVRLDNSVFAGITDEGEFTDAEWGEYFDTTKLDKGETITAGLLLDWDEVPENAKTKDGPVRVKYEKDKNKVIWNFPKSDKVVECKTLDEVNKQLPNQRIRIKVKYTGTPYLDSDEPDMAEFEIKGGNGFGDDIVVVSDKDTIRRFIKKGENKTSILEGTINNKRRNGGGAESSTFNRVTITDIKIIE